MLLLKKKKLSLQRFDYTVLKPFLPPKFEYVVSVQLSEIQCTLYQYYLDNLAQGGPKRQSSGLFVDFSALSRVWTHPKVLELAERRAVVSHLFSLIVSFNLNVMLIGSRLHSTKFHTCTNIGP